MSIHADHALVRAEMEWRYTDRYAGRPGTWPSGRSLRSVAAWVARRARRAGAMGTTPRVGPAAPAC